MHYQHPQQHPMQYAQAQYSAPPNTMNAYGCYGQNFQQNVFQQNAWQAMNFQTEDQFAAVFHQYCSPTLGGIQAEELCRIMNEDPRIRNYYRINWSLELCKVMSAMLDRSKDGVMQYPEFLELLQCLVYWHQVFCQYDTNRSGYIEANELANIIRHRFSYNLTVEAMTVLLKRYSKAMDNGQCLVAFDDFVSLSVRLRAYTEAFRARDRQQNGQETGYYRFSYDDFIRSTLCL